MTTLERIKTAVGDCPDERRVNLNTYVGLNNRHGYYVKLYETVILSAVRDVVTVDSGCHRTRLTLSRINDYLGDDLKLVSESRQWHWRRVNHHPTFVYQDGDKITPHDEVLSQSEPFSQIDAYAYATAAVFNESLAQPHEHAVRRSVRWIIPDSPAPAAAASFNVLSHVETPPLNLDDIFAAHYLLSRGSP